MKKIVPLLIIFISILNVSFAHSGRTDSNGGHYDRSTGEYHYHHGYSEHLHIKGLCPYEAELSELLPEVCPNCNSIVNEKNGYYCFECAYELVPLSNLQIFSPVNGDVDKTRNEYFEEVQSLESKIDEKEKIINNLYNVIDDKEIEIRDLEHKQKNFIINYFIGFIFIFLIGICISYNIGKDKIKK